VIKKFATVIGFVAALASANAQQNYAFRKNDIRAAIFELRGNTGTSAPHVWFNLDSNTSIKPAGWNFTNPLAPSQLDQAFFDDATLFGVTKPPVGTSVTKRTARYWWVDLAEQNDEQLALIDVALIQVRAPDLNVTPGDRDRLRKYVDRGGILWIDLAYGAVNQANGFPFPFRSFVPPQPNLNVSWDSRSPLLRTPNTLSPGEISTLATGSTFAVAPVTQQSLATVDPSTFGSVGGFLSNLLGESKRLKEVTFAGGAGDLPTIMTGRIGAGFVVITSRGVSEMINRVGSNVNRSYFAIDPSSDTKRSNSGSTAANIAAKFIINVISASSDVAQAGGDSRQSSSSFVDVGAPLLRSWSSRYRNAPADLGDPIADAGKRARPPVLYKGMTFVAKNDSILCYDTDPKVDADRDGNPDDGVEDLSLGGSQDLIFSTNPVPGGISSAVCVEVPSSTVKDQLLVTTSTGQLLVYSIYDAGNGRRFRAAGSNVNIAPSSTISPPSAGTMATPTAPTVHEGIAYVADRVVNGLNPGGRVWQADLVNLDNVRSANVGSTPFVYGGPLAPYQPISASPTVGYIPIQDNSGGNDKVAYLPLEPVAGSAPTSAGVLSVWLGARSERPSAADVSGLSLTITTRAALQGGLPIYLSSSPSDPLNPHISVIRRDGTVYTAADMASVFSGAPSQNQGTLTLTLNGAWPPADVDPENAFRVDYTIDWGAAGPNMASLERGRLFFPGRTDRFIVGGLALSPTGSLFATVSTQRPNLTGFNSINNDYLGSVFSVREEGRGVFKMNYRWDLYPQHQFSSSTGTQTVPAALPDNDPVQYLNIGGFQLKNVLGGSFRATCFQGGPVIRNGDVFVTVSGTKVLAPSSAILCFKDDTSAREIRVPGLLTQQSSIAQPDIARSQDPTRPSTLSVMPPSSYRIERETGSSFSVVRFDSVMESRSGAIINSLSTSQPVIVRETGKPDIVLDPNQQGDRWSPLKWYSIMHGMEVRSSAFATGSTVFVSGQSYLPLILNGVFPPTGPLPGFTIAFNTDFDVSTARRASQSVQNNPLTFDSVEVVADDSRPYMRQVIALDYPRAGTTWDSQQLSLDQLRGSQLVVWPQTPRTSEEQSFITFDDFRIRVNQAAIFRPGAPTSYGSYGIVGGEGTLVAWNNERVVSYKRASTWVADEGRVLQVDPSGNVLFDSSTVASSGPVAGATEALKFARIARPTRIYPVGGTSDVLVVDSDKNQIIRMNPYGQVVREINGLNLDPNFIPAGFRTGAPLTLENPRDVVYFTSRVELADNPFTVKRAEEFWVNYIVADQGHDRLIHLVDRYEVDPTNGNLRGLVGDVSQLFWHSPAAVSGRGFAYNSVSRVQTGANNFTLVAGVSGKSATERDLGGTAVLGDLGTSEKRSAQSGNGSVLVFDSSFANGYAAFSQIRTPAVNHTRRWDFVTGNWSTAPAVDIAERNPLVGSGKYLSNLQSVTASQTESGTPGLSNLAIMISDSTGVYEVTIAGGAGGSYLETRWMLPSWAYQNMRRVGVNGVGSPTNDNPIGFLPTYARRLNDDEVILVNGYQGLTIGSLLGLQPSNFRGEILQVDGRVDNLIGLQPINYESKGYSPNVINLGFNTLSIRLRLGPLAGTRGLVLPVFADRK
jgi:hypothetical protein